MGICTCVLSGCSQVLGWSLDTRLVVEIANQIYPINLIDEIVDIEVAGQEVAK